MFWLILSVLLWGFLHSLLASLEIKDLARRRLGERFMRFYRLAYNLFAGLTFLPALILAALTPDRQLYLVPLPWSALMVFGQGLAVVALVVGFLQSDPAEFLGLKQAAGPLTARGGELIVSGLYRYVRHPLYTGGLAFIWLMPLMTTHVLAINIGLTVYILAGAWFEERKLLREFGEQYSRYQSVTPMLIPLIKGNKRGGSASK
jgi:protein-S-isoprenylcysteine O-methyltransferase Ste14